MGLELVDDGCEDGVGEAVEGAPVGVAERGFEGPDVFRGERAEGGDGVVGGGVVVGVGVGVVVGGGGGGGVGVGRGGGGARGGDVGEDGCDCEEEEGGDGGGVEEGGGVGGG